jgi:hypothetical protein
MAAVDWLRTPGTQAESRMAAVDCVTVPSAAVVVG